MRPTRLGLIRATITVIAPIAPFPDSATSRDDRLITLSVPKTQYALGEKIVVTVTTHVDHLRVTTVDDCLMRADTSFLMIAKNGKATSLCWRDREKVCFMSVPGVDPNATPRGWRLPYGSGCDDVDFGIRLFCTTASFQPLGVDAQTCVKR